MKKTFKWHGTTFGELKEFIAQAEAEGATPETEFQRVGGEHLHITIELPLVPVKQDT